MTLDLAMGVTALLYVLPLVLFAGLTVWVVRSITRSRRESDAVAANSNDLVVEHLRGVKDRLDRIEQQLADIPE